MKSLTGFTLFQTSRGWQLSTREREQDAWSVRIIPQEEADALLKAVAPLTPAYSHEGPTDLFGRPVQQQRRKRVFL